MSESQRLRRLDLNLLRSLDSLLRERNVSRAAAAANVSQPAMSAALARLRRHFDDELLVRHDNNRYELTFLAQQLRPILTEALEVVDRVAGSHMAFDSEADFQISVICGEVVAAMALPTIRRRKIESAPNSTLRVIEPGRLTSAELVNSLTNDVDGIFLPHGWIQGLESIDIFEDRWVFAVAEDDPTPALTMADLETRPWLVAQVGKGDYARGMQQVLAAGVRPRIDVVVAGSMSMPFFLRGTDRVAVTGRRMIDDMGDLFGIREVPGPIELEGTRHAFWWHPSRRDHPTHRWFRELVANARIYPAT